MSNFHKSHDTRKRRPRMTGKKLTKTQVNQVKSLINTEIKPELKYYDSVFNSLDVNSSPYFNDSFQPARGTLINARVGSSVKLESIFFKLRFVIGDSTQYCRFVMFQWYPDRGSTVPAWTKMFQYHNGVIPIQQLDFMSPLALGVGNVGEYKILKNIEFNLDIDNVVQTVTGFIDTGFKKDITFEDDSTLAGQNHIYYMVVSDSGAVTHPKVDGYLRYRYTDC